MNRHTVTVLLALLTLCLPVAARQDQSYRLRQLSADEYLTGILRDVWPEQSFCSFDINTACHLPRLLAQEIMLRYPRLDVGYETLRTAYDRIVRLARWSDAAAEYWTQQVILAWLHDQNRVIDNLPPQPTIQPGSVLPRDVMFGIQVTPLELDGDEHPEWVLDVDSGVRGFKGLLVLAQNADGDDYFLDTGFPVERPCCFNDIDWRSWHSVNLVRADDVNDDGRDELVAFTLGSSRYDTHNTGRLYVLGLRDGLLTDLMAEPLEYTEPAYLHVTLPDETYQTTGHSWVFAPVEGAPALTQTWRRQDNFDCVWYETLRYSWREDRFRLPDPEPEIRFANSSACDLRHAEEAAWSADFQTALNHYQDFLAGDIPSDPAAPWLAAAHAERRAYALIRAALAWQQLGQTEPARDALNQVSQETDSAYFTDLAGRLLPLVDQPFQSCVSSYQYFYALNVQGIFHDRYVGSLYEMPGGSYPPAPPPPDPVLSGCDVLRMVDTAVGGLSLDTATPLPEQLQSLGIPPLVARSADFNHDDVDDWLIWYAAGLDAHVFVSTPDNAYTVSRSSVSLPASDVIVFAHPLPGDAGDALVVIDRSPYALTPTRLGMYCQQPVQSHSFLEIWWLADGNFQKQLEAPICEDASQPEQLFPSEGVVRVGALLVRGQGYVTVDYVWDAAKQMFIPPDTGPLTDVAPEEYPAVNQREYTGDTFLESLDTRSASALLQGIDTYLQKYPDDPSALYERGLLLELDGQFDAALAAYLTLYQRFPESQYGRLAALHLEPGI